MSAFAKTEEKNTSWKHYFWMGYIIFTFILIAYLIFSYFRWGVFAAGQQSWYQAAVNDLMLQVSDKCEPVVVNSWDTKVEIINVACLQQPEDAQTQDTSWQ